MRPIPGAPPDRLSLAHEVSESLSFPAKRAGGTLQLVSGAPLQTLTDPVSQVSYGVTLRGPMPGEAVQKLQEMPEVQAALKAAITEDLSEVKGFRI